MTSDLDKSYLGKRGNLIKLLMKKLEREIQSINYQIKRDIEFWMKYRPSLWLSFSPKRLEELILGFIEKKGNKEFVFYTALLCCLIFVGFVPTLRLLLWYLFRIWLICIVIPLAYWVTAISIVYSRVILIKLVGFILAVFDKLIDRDF